MENLEIYQLSNGITIAHREDHTTRITHCGFTLDVGSRDEEEHEYGIAHFWEHMVFKGTHKRKAFHILNRLEAVGGELNAYTTKDKICIYSSVLHTYFPKAFELLADITFNSTFPSTQLEKERNVILEEMAMYRDSPEDAIQDDFESLVFDGHSLGANILGTPDTINRFTRQDFNTFIRKNMDTHRVIFSSIGPVPMKRVVKLAKQYLEAVPENVVEKDRIPFSGYQPRQETINRKLTQSQVALGNVSYPRNHPLKIPFFMLVNLLGGPGMNSRLNLALREKFGYVYAIDAVYSAYEDTALFAIYFGTDPGRAKKSLELVKKELRKLGDKPLGVVQLQRAKEQLKGQLAMGQESKISYMLMVGKSLLEKGKVEPLESIFKKIDNTSADLLQEIAVDIFAEDRLSSLTYIPEN